MFYNFLLYIQQALLFLLSGASTLPFLIALGLIIGRRGHATFCIFGSRKMSALALGLAWAGLFYFPASYLATVLPYGLNKSILDSILLPQGRPWLAATLCWLAGIFILFLATAALRSLRQPAAEERYQFRFIRSVFLLFCLTSLAFFTSLFMEHWPFAGLPEGLSMERAGMAIARHTIRRFFQGFSPAGALSLLYAAWVFRQLSFKKLSQEKRGTLRWLAFWAAAGAAPGLFISWGLLLASWTRAAIPGMGSTTPVLFGLIFQGMAIAIWVWIICRPGKSSPRVILAFLLTLLHSFWPLLIRLA